MPDARISELPAASTLGDTDLAPLVQASGSTTETRRATLAQLRGAVLVDRGAHVRDYGAKGDGSTDDGPAFQAAIDDLKTKGGGTLFLGPKVYRIASPVVLNGATIRLQGAGFTEGPGAGQGTWLRINTTGFTPFTFTGVNRRGAGLRDIAVQQTHGAAQVSGWAPTAYDYVFRIEDCFGGVDFDNVFLCNVNKGIFCRNSGRLDIRRLRAQVFTTGVEVDQCYDIPRIHSVHFWNFWSSNAFILAWQQANADAMVFRRSDGVFIDQAFVLGYRSMFRFGSSESGVTTKFYIGQAYADFVKYGIWVEGSGTDGQVANFTSHNEIFNAAGAPLPGSAAIQVDGSNTRVQIGNLRTDAVEDSAIWVNSTGNRLDIFSLRCTRFNTRNNGAAAIHIADSGAATPNAVYLGTPPLLENGGLVVNAGTNAVLASGTPAGQAARPGLAVGGVDTGLFLPAGGSLAASAGGAEVLRATAAGGITFGGAPGGHALEVATPAGTVNRLLIGGATTGSPVTAQAQGADANIGLQLAAKGTGTVALQANGATAFAIGNAAAPAVNWLRADGGVAGGAVTLSAQGSDAAIGITLAPKGTGLVRTTTPASTDNSTAIATTAFVRAQNYTVAGAVASVADGTAAAPGLGFAGAAATGLSRAATGALSLSVNGLETVRVAPVASAVNRLGLYGSAAGTAAALLAEGSDTNIGLVLGPKGSGALSAMMPDNAATGGNARGASAVDWQQFRSTAAQIAGGAYSTVSGGRNNAALGTTSVVAGGDTNSASAGASWVPGGQQASTGLTINRGAWSAGRFSVNGDAQAGEFVLRRQSTDATATRLTADNLAPGGSNQAILPTNGSYRLKLLVLARQVGGTAGTAGDTASWEASLLIRRGATVAATVLVGGTALGSGPALAPITAGTGFAPGIGDSGAAAWRLILDADTTNGGLAISGTGEAGKTVNWVARLLSVEAVG
ncbi:glycosyl hydrolase family 28-related protein [Belnapia sp. F-4-1]|uniref:glycosyl hydrolase family 28-related protein n=1 Tax=Belnapia sp. F-4-1 TaxID=1545443 RepID=UPI0005BB45B5|nr:glycosyl hydrolase family 28-related protein [Belnapia sp. F-4-1]